LRHEVSKVKNTKMEFKKVFCPSVQTGKVCNLEVSRANLKLKKK